MNDFEGKVAVITGAGHKNWIGFATAVRLAKGRATIVAVDEELTREMLYPAEVAEGWRGLPSVVEEIGKLGRPALPITADVSKEEDVKRVVNKAVQEFGRIDILVNSAATFGERGTAVVDLELQDWIQPFGMNLNSMFLCCREVGKQMIKQKKGGKIVNIASSTAKLGRAKRAAYSSSKFGVIGLTQSLAEELAPHDINVNAVCQGALYHGGAHEVIAAQAKRQGISFEQAKEEFYKYSLSRCCLKRCGTPQDVANLIAFLASHESDYITGQSINVDGGFLMAH